MNIITISREFGSGGRELGKRLADDLGFDYYDSEIIAAIAKNKGLTQEYVEETLENHGWQSFPITYNGTLSSAEYFQSSKVELLLEQRRVIEGIAALGKDCVIVGRNADVLLEQYEPLDLFVCAQTSAKLRRCRERAKPGENLSDRELQRKMKQIDRMRAQTREFLSGSGWGKRDAYHLTVNTTDWDLKELAAAMADFARRWFARTK